MEAKKNNLYELTNPQKNIFLTEQYYSGTTINNICGTAIIYSEINFELLKKAMNITIKNNDNFQLHFKLDGNIVMQYLTKYKNVEINVQEIADVSCIKNIEEEMQSKKYEIFSENNMFEIVIFKFPNNQGGFCINIHHLLADSWALGLFCRQVINNYNLLLNGNEDIEYKTKFSYLDYINNEENEYMSSNKFIKDEQYWSSVFSNIPENITIPSKFNCLGKETECKAKRSTYVISKELNSEITEFCKENNISNFNFFMSVYAIYLSKINNSHDFVIGTPILNRVNYNQKNTMGMFISTLPVRINVNNESTFCEFSKNIACNSLTMLRHQKYPYQNILENLRKKQPNLPNLYNILLSYQITKTNTEGYNYETRWAFNGNCADDIQIHILDINDTGNTNICYDYKTNKYDNDDIEKFHKRILSIINQIIKCKDLKINNINILTQEEINNIFNKFNCTNVKYGKNKNIMDLFEEKVKKFPQNTAIVCDDEKITYDQLNKQANQLANYLIKNNINKTDIVGVMISRSIEMVVSLIAILKIGATYIPIDPKYPEERVLYLVENSNAKAILVDNTTYANVENVFKINISTSKNEYLKEDTNNLNVSINSQDLMYLIYTSGSTGKPKGVMITHNNVHNFLIGINSIIDFKNNKTILSLTTICFDIFGLELWGGLTNGLTVVVATEKEQNNTYLLNKLCLENNVDMIQTTPSRMSFLLKDEENLEFLRSVNTIMLGGEALPKNVIDNVFKHSNAKLFNMYGPTETTIWSTIKNIIKNENISIGTPIANTRCYILNNDLELLPPYTPGNLCISGDGLSKGYYNMPELTMQKFTPLPYNKNEIIYKTGDLAYYDENGNLYHLGRSDFQVKLRGYRIELGEIENIILSYGNINEVAVIAQDNHLICYYTSDKNVNEADVVSYLLNNLPEYMVPSDFIKLDKMPLTPNGKLDRKNLPKNIKNKIIEELPKTRTEKLLTEIVCDITHKEVKNINDSFMTLGLDSLGIIQAQTELLSKNINLTTHYFYKYPTIKKLAQKIENNVDDYKEKQSEIPEEFKHYPDEILEKIKDININENILGNVFLTGSNGFIGIHILNELLETTENKIYCLVRGETSEFRIDKLNSTYKYYFNKDLTKYINERIFIIGGDTSYENLNLSAQDLESIKNNVNTIINTAAIVKHYGNIEEFKKNNIQSTQNITKLAYENNIRLIHLSSISVSGNYLVKQDNHNVNFGENDLYIGQHYEDNNYVYSKMESEKCILKYMEKGLTAQILRIGIVSGRFSDGFFQKKINENAFYGRIKSIVEMSAVSDTMLLQKIEFTPVDLCAKAIVTLAKNSVANNKIYNIYNHNLITVEKIIKVLKMLNIDIKILNSSEFNNYVLELSRTNIDSLKGIINDFNYDSNNLLTVNYNFTVNIQSEYTKKYLHLLNFDWPIIDEEYLIKIITHMKNVKFI